MAEQGPAPPAVAAVALLGLCPRCGGRTLFDGPASVADCCSNCGLDFQAYPVGDRPAALLMMMLAGGIGFIAVMIDEAFRPPLWLQPLVWIPVTAGAVVLALRIVKAGRLAARYRRAPIVEGAHR